MIPSVWQSLVTRATALRAAWRRRLGRRPDTEREQALVRLFIMAFIFAYVAYLDYSGGDLAVPKSNLYVIVGGFCVVSIVIFIGTLLSQGTSGLRHYSSLLLDLVGTTYLIYACENYGIVFYVLYLWITVGYGIRYGVRYLYTGTVLSVVGFLVTLSASDYWEGRMDIGYALLPPLFLIPLYTSALLNKLTAAKIRAERASRAKSDFLAMVSHEIRTPLHGILGTAQLLQNEGLDDKQRELLEIIRKSGQVLVGLIDNILDVSKIEAGKLTLQEENVDLYELFVSSYKLFAAQAQERHTTFKLQLALALPRYARADGMRLKQVLNNLIGNAVKFTQDGTVSVKAALERGPGRPALCVEVEDTGIGMDEETQQRVFEPFVQARGVVGQRSQGTGLGTTIAKDLVTLMGGEIGVRSKLGEGTTFWFKIPLRPAAGRRPAGTERAGGSVLLLRGSGNGRAQEFIAQLSAAGIQVHRDGTDPGELKEPGDYDAVLYVGEEESGAAAAQTDFWDSVWTIPKIHFPAGEETLYLRAGPTTQLGLTAAHPLPPAQVRKAFGFFHIVRGNREAGPAANEGAVQGPALRVLIVDDNEANRLLLHRAVESFGHRAETALNGEHALQCLEQSPFDVVLMDVQMPVMDGIEATQLYRFGAVAGEGDCPVYALTADVTGDIEERCKRAGMDGYLSKPVDLNRLRALLDEIAQRRACRGTGAPATHRGVDIVDPDVLTGLLEIGSPDFVRKLFQTFLEDFDDEIRRLEEAARRHAWQKFRHGVHAIKGSAANLGVTPLVQACQAVEGMSDPGLAQEARHWCRVLRGTRARLEKKICGDLLSGDWAA